MSIPLTSSLNSNIAGGFLTQQEHIRRWARTEAHRAYAVLKRSRMEDNFQHFRHAAESQLLECTVQFNEIHSLAPWFCS
jgi:hypothetical protein